MEEIDVFKINDDDDDGGQCSETKVGIKENMVLEMPSENWQCQGRRNMGRHLIDYSRHEMQWMKKILKWPLMFSSMMQT